MTTASHPFQLEAVTKRYAAFALGPLDLVAPRGYVTGLVGANGAGKTTAIKIALSAVRPDGAGPPDRQDSRRHRPGPALLAA